MLLKFKTHYDQQNSVRYASEFWVSLILPGQDP